MAARKTTESAPVVAACVRALVGGLGRLRLPAARKLGIGVGYALWWTPNRLRAVSQRNIGRCFPELEEDERQRLVRASLLALGTTIAEAGAMWTWPEGRLRELEESAEGESLLRAALERRKGVLLLGPHIGNWEFLSHWLTRRCGLLSLYRPPRIAELDAYIMRARQRLGAEMAPASSAGLKRIAGALRTGRLVGILADQEPLKGHGVFAPFFGTPALTMTLVSSLVRRFEPEVLYAFAQRTPTGFFRVRIFPAPGEIGSADPIAAATALNSGIEECVRRCPQQYVWSYRRFRTRPLEELAARTAG